MANNTAFQLIFFMLVFNAAAGLMIMGIVDINGNRIFDVSNMGGYVHNTTDTDEFIENMEKTITPGGELEDKGDQIYRVLDLVNIGFFKRFIDTIDNLLFGFWNVLEGILGGFLDPGFRVFLFATIKTLTTIAYVIAAFNLWTGKDLAGD